MAKPGDHMKELEEQIIGGVRSFGTMMEPPTPFNAALTPLEQTRALIDITEEETQPSVSLSQQEPELVADSEQRQPDSTVMNTKQLEYKQTTVNMKTNREISKRLRQLTYQLMEEFEQQSEDTERKRNEIGYLKTKTEEQQKDIDRLTAEKHDQYLLIKTLRLKIENYAEKLKKNKNEATQEEKQFLKIQAEISHERETLDRVRHEIINKRHKLEMIMYAKTRQVPKEPKEPMVKREHEIMVSLLSVINKNQKVMLEAKQAKEQTEKSIANIKQELKSSKKDISQQRDQLENFKHNIKLNINKMKQRWLKIQRDTQMQKAAVSELEKGEKQKKRKDTDTFDSVKVKLRRIREEIEKLWDVLEDSEQLEVTLREESNIESGQMENIKSDAQKQQDREVMKAYMEIQKQQMKIQQLDNKLQINKKRKLEVMNTETEMKKRDLMKMARMSRRKKEKISKKKKETEHAKQDMEDRQVKSKEQRSEQVLDEQHKESQFEEGREISTMNKVKADMQRVISEVQKIRKMLHMVRKDKEQRKGTFIEEKNQIKWRNFQEKKKRQKLEQWQEKTIKERDELEIMKIKMQQKRKEAEQKLEDTITAILTVSEMKANTEKAATKMNDMQEEMLKAQREMEKNKEEVKTYMDKLVSMKARVSRWILTESAIKKTFSVKISKLQTPQEETDRESLKDQTLEIPSDKERAEGEMTKEAVSLQQLFTLEDQHQSEETKEQAQRQSEHKQFPAVDTGEKQNVFLQMQTEYHKETLVDEDQTEIIINVRQKVEVEKQISKLKERKEKIKEQIKYAMENMEEKNQEIKRLIMDINDLQSQRPMSETDLQILFRETGNVEAEETRLLQEREHFGSLWVTSVFTNEINTDEVQVQNEENGKQVKQEVIDESDLMRLDLEKQKQRQESKKDLQTQTEEVDGCFDKMDTESSDIQKLRAEMCRTQKIIRLVKLELKHQSEKFNIDKDHTNKDKSDKTEGLLEEMKQFQEFLKMVKTAMRESEIRLKEETSNMKLMETAAKKHKRELDQRLEKTLRERDDLDILKIKILRQSEEIEQKLRKMSRVMSTVAKMVVKTRKKSEETKIKQRQLDDLNFKLKATKHNLVSSYLLISQERADIEKFKNEIRQKKEGECALEKAERKWRDIKKRDRAEIDAERDRLTEDSKDKEIEEMGNEICGLRQVKEKMAEDITLTLDILEKKNCESEQLTYSISEQVKRRTKRDENEMLKKQIPVENENVKIARQQAEAEIHKMNCLRECIQRQKQELDDRAQTVKREVREMELLKSELEIKRKEGEHVFRKSMRKKEEIEIMWNEIQREKELLRRETKKRGRELDQRLEKTMRERDELEVLRINLQQQKKELTEKKQSIKDPTTLIQQYREYEKQSLEKKQVRAIKEEAEMVQQSSKAIDFMIDQQNMWHKIHVNLEIIRREMVTLENVNVHLVKQREGLKALKGENRIVRDHVVKIKSQIKMACEKLMIQAKAEMDGIVQMRDNIQKQKQELDIRLEKIKRERREMEVLKFELEIKKRETQQMIRKGIRNDQEVKKMWDNIKGEKDALKRETRKRKKELDQQMERIIKERDELEIMKLKLQREKDESRCGTEQLTANQIHKHWELSQMCIEKCKHMKKHSEDLNEAIKDGKRLVAAQTNIIAQAREEVEIIKMDIKRHKEMMICALQRMQHEETHLEQVEIKRKSIEKERYTEKSEELLLRERKRLINNNGSEKELEISESERKLMQNQKNESKEIKKEVQCVKKQGEKEEVNLTDELKEKITSDKQMETFGLELNERLGRNIKKEETILMSELQLHGKLDTKSGKQKLHRKNKIKKTEKKTKVKVKENEDGEKLREELKQDREDLDRVNEMMNKERQALDLTKSDILKQIGLLEQEKHNINEQKEKLEVTKTELQKKKEHADSLLDEINREKTKMNHLTLQLQRERNKLETAIPMITLKLQEQELHDDNIRRLKLELESSEKSVLAERKEVEILRNNLDKMKKEVEAKMNSISGERQHLSQMKTDIDRERDMILNEKDKLERERSELMMGEHQVINKMKDLESLRVKLQHVNERMRDNIKHKMQHLQQNSEGMLIVYTSLEERLTELDGQKENMACYYELIEREKEGLISILSDIVVQKQDIENLWKQRFMTEKLHLDKLKAELKEEREDLDRVNEMMKKDKMDLELMRSDILKQTDILEQDKRDIEDGKEKLEVTKTKLRKEKEHADSLLGEINREKTNIKDLTRQVQREQNELQNVINIIALKLKDQQLKDNDIKRQTQELETHKNSVLAEREGLQDLRKDLKKKKEEIAAALNSISGKREELIQMKVSLDMDREKLENEKDKVKAELSELKMREDQFMGKILSVQILRGKLKELNEKTCGDIKNKIDKLDQSSKGMQILCLVLEKKLADFNEETSQIPVYTELIQKEKSNLIGILSETVTEPDEYEVTTAELQSKKEHLDSLLHEINQEKEELYQIKINIESERDMFLNQNMSIEGEMSELTIREYWFTMGSLRAKLKHLNQRTHEDFRINMEKLEYRNGAILQLNSILEDKCAELDKQKNIIIGYFDLIQREDKHVVTITFDKAIQYEVTEEELLQEHDVEKQDLNTHREFECEKDFPQYGVEIQTEEFVNQWKLKEDKGDFEREDKHLTSQRDTLHMVAGGELENKQDDFTDKKLSKRDCLRKIWKDTKIERKGINQMKCRGHEIRNNLEKRLKVINQFVKRSWSQKGQEPLEQTKQKQELSKNTSKSEWERDHKRLDETYADLQQVKVQMLSEIEKIKEKLFRTTTTRDKANQTFQVDMIAGDEAEQPVQAMQQASTKTNQEQMKLEETEAASETSIGLLCQFWSYCYHCCRPCCACCKEMYPEEK